MSVEQEPVEEEPVEEPAEQLEEEEEVLEDGVEVQEHLKDAVEGSLRLKRYLTRDEDEEGAKKQKVEDTPEQKIVKQLMQKWRCTCLVCKHILDHLKPDELDTIVKSGFFLQQSNEWRSAPEMLAKHVCELRERQLPTGGVLDTVSSFRARWKLSIDAEKSLRALSHKDLRYVLNEYDGNVQLEDVISDAAGSIPADEETAEQGLPDKPGPATMSRFSRLELIDPLADAAVFGDANLTFSLRLAKHRKSLGHVGRVIATTFEELDTLRERYKEIDESIQILEDHYAEVYHGVDCTRIAIDSRFENLEGSLGAVYYNFPHSGAIQGFFDGHPVVNWRHENLMRLFFRALRSFVKPGGVVRVSSNQGAIGVRFSYIIGSAIENEFIHTETMPFLEWHLHRYGRSYGDRRDVYKRPDAKNNQSYNSQRADTDMVYCFRYAPSGDSLPKQTIRMPPTLKVLNACVDGPFKNLPAASKQNLAKQLHQRFVTEVSGTHVG